MRCRGGTALSPSRIHCANAIPKTVAPDCAARVAVGSLMPRARRASATVLARPASLCCSRSRSAGFWSITDCRMREYGRRSSGNNDGRAQRGGDDLERGGVRRCGVHPVDERLQELLLPVEQHLALVAEVPEEGALGQPDGLRDLRGGRLLEAAGGEQLECRCLQALSRTRLPSHHGPSLVMTVTAVRCMVMSVADISH